MWMLERRVGGRGSRMLSLGGYRCGRVLLGGWWRNGFVSGVCMCLVRENGGMYTDLGGTLYGLFAREICRPGCGGGWWESFLLHEPARRIRWLLCLMLRGDLLLVLRYWLGAPDAIVVVVLAGDLLGWPWSADQVKEGLIRRVPGKRIVDVLPKIWLQCSKQCKLCLGVYTDLPTRAS